MGSNADNQSGIDDDQNERQRKIKGELQMLSKENSPRISEFSTSKDRMYIKGAKEQE